MDVIADKVMPWLAEMRAAGAVEIQLFGRADGRDRLAAVRREAVLSRDGAVIGQRNRAVGELLVDEGGGLSRRLGMPADQVAETLTGWLASEPVRRLAESVAREAELAATPEAWAEGW